MSLTSFAIAYMPPSLFQCTTAASVHLFSDNSMHNQSIDIIEMSYEMLLIYRACYIGYDASGAWYDFIVQSVHIIKWAIYEMLLTYQHVMLVIQSMMHPMHDTILSCMQSIHTIKCDRMLLSMMHSMFYAMSISSIITNITTNNKCSSRIDPYWYRSIPILLYIGSGMSMNWSAYSARAIVYLFYGL